MGIYLDYLATTPVDLRVLEAMLPYFHAEFGNPASRSHAFGWRARAAVEEAREQTANLIGAHPEEIVFTSGATEAINLALRGLVARRPEGRSRLLVARGEHRAVLDTAEDLRSRGLQVDLAEIDADGQVIVEGFEGRLGESTLLSCVQWANNEVGTVQPVGALAEACRAHGSRFFCDATQAVGKLPVDLGETGIDLACLSAHKIYGPKGVGALYIRKGEPRLRLAPQITGGGHERGLRAGTSNVPGIVGLGRACEIAAQEMEAEGTRLLGLRERLEGGLKARLEGVQRNGEPGQSLPGCLNLTFEGVAAEDLMMELGDIAVSSGSACTSARPEPSHVLGAMGLSASRAQSSIRFGLGRFTTREEIDQTIERVSRAVGKLRSPLGTAPRAPEKGS